MVNCLECMKRFSQIVLIITNIIVAVIGFAVMVLGIWANVEGKNYVDVTNSSSHFAELSVLVIILGLFVMLIGVVGTVGAIFASTIFGRITLGLYAVVLTLLVICEIAGGIAAAVKKNEINDLVQRGLNDTFQQYNSSDSSKRDSWDQMQKGLKCCGLNNYTDFATILGLAHLPASCCPNPQDGSCTVEFYQKPCTTALSDLFRGNLGIVAGFVIFFGLVQIFGIVMACFVAIYQKKEKYEVV